MAQELHEELSARELEILEQVATGATNQQIAVSLRISVNTVKAHLRNIFAKLGVESRTEATLYAIQHGLIAVARPEETAPPPSEGAPVRAFPLEEVWALARGPRLALLAVFVAILVAALWPNARASTPQPAGYLVDEPRPSAAEREVNASSRWRSKAQMPTPRGRFAQAEVGGIIYVIAGLTDEGWTSRVEAYDPSQDLWMRRASKPTAVANAGAVAVNGLIYVPGGLGEDDRVRDVLEVYDPTGDTWSVRRPLPRPLCAYAIAPYGAGFYLFGGWDGTTYQDRTYYYDAVADAWREEAPLRKARAFAAAVTVENRIYLVGGYDGEHTLRVCESYTPGASDPWQEHAPMRFGRAGHAAATVLGNLYVIGGGWDEPLAYNERYDIKNDAWSTFDSPIVGPWRALGVSPISSGDGTFLYAVGGWNGRYLSSVKAYQAVFRIYVP